MGQATGSDHQDPLVQRGQIVPTAVPKARQRRSGPSGVAIELMKIGTTGRDRGVPEQLLQRLHRAVVHVHARRDRDVDVGAEHGLRAVGRDVFGNIERTGVGAVVANPLARMPIQNGGITL